MSSMQVDEVESAGGASNPGVSAPGAPTADPEPHTPASGSDDDVEFNMGNANANLGNAHEINQIVASIPYHRIPKGVTCYSCGTWNRVQPRVTQKHYAIARGEFVGVFFNEWESIKPWVERYSNNNVKGFGVNDREEAVKHLDGLLAEGKVFDKHGQVSAFVDGKPVYVPDTRGVTLLSIPSMPISSPLPDPY